jgi:hypothetical protein
VLGGDLGFMVFFCKEFQSGAIFWYTAVVNLSSALEGVKNWITK